MKGPQHMTTRERIAWLACVDEHDLWGEFGERLAHADSLPAPSDLCRRADGTCDGTCHWKQVPL